MEEKINIAEILKDKKNGLRLYSPIFGECTFCCVREETNDICIKKDNGVKEFFDSKGLYYNTGEVMLFPLKEMREWNKLYWKKGDVLVNEDGDAHVIFKRFDDDTYKTFNGNYYLENNVGIVSFVEHEGNFLTSDFYKENKENAQEYIRKIEEKLGGKLNSDNFEIEKTHQEFKDGDIVTIINGCEQRCILIFRNIIGDSLNRYCILTKRGLFTEGYSLIDKEDSLLFATEEDKEKLFSALEKEGKVWDAANKKVVDIKKEHQFKPFEKVLVRDSYEDKWRASFFSHIREGYAKYVTTGLVWKFCIPYEGNEHLLDD